MSTSVTRASCPRPHHPTPPLTRKHSHNLGLKTISSLNLTPCLCLAAAALSSTCYQELTARGSGILHPLCAQVRRWGPKGKGCPVLPSLLFRPSLEGTVLPAERVLHSDNGRGQRTLDAQKRGLHFPRHNGEPLSFFNMHKLWEWQGFFHQLA